MTPQWVPTPEITEVLDLQSGQHRSASDVIGSDYAQVVQLRTAIKDGQKQDTPVCVLDLLGVGEPFDAPAKWSLLFPPPS
jgi:hypothetical protein